MESNAHMVAATTVTKGTGTEDIDMLHRSKIFICLRSISRSSSREQTWDRNNRNFKKKGSRSNRTARAGKKARQPEEEKTQGKDSRGT